MASSLKTTKMPAIGERVLHQEEVYEPLEMQCKGINNASLCMSTHQVHWDLFRRQASMYRITAESTLLSGTDSFISM